MLTQSENTVLLLGFVALAALFLSRGGSAKGASAPQPTTTDDRDIWATPFYLRSNVPVMTGDRYVMPQNSWASWALAIPQPSAQRGSGYGQ